MQIHRQKEKSHFLFEENVSHMNTLRVQVLLEGDSFTLSFDFTLFRVVKETAAYTESHFKNSRAA